MARIRTIKPEFWTSDQIVNCSTLARLLFIGLWSFCDDGGVHPASIKRLKMEVFPGDAIDDDAMGKLIGELVRADLVREFDAGGERFWHVTGWHRHQRIDKPTIRHPRPPDRLAILPNDHPAFDESSMNARRDVVEPSPPEWNGIGVDGDETAFVRDYVKPKILIVSDPIPPKGDASQYNADVLMRIINRRYCEYKPTWFTLNVLDGEEAERRLASPIVDRRSCPPRLAVSRMQLANLPHTSGGMTTFAHRYCYLRPSGKEHPS